jgi:6-phosphogluconolactonase
MESRNRVEKWEEKNGRRMRGAGALGGAAVLMLAGCAGFFVYPGSNGGGGGNSNTGDYVYVVNATTDTLAGFSVGTGTLTAVSGSPYGLGFVPTAVVVNPANTRVYVAGINLGTAYINVYSIGTGGALSLLLSNNVGAGEASMDVSPDGDWLVGLNSNSVRGTEVVIDEYSISSDGHLGVDVQTPYPYSGVVPYTVRFAPNGNVFFVAAGSAGDIVFPFTTSNGSIGTPLSLGVGAGTSDNALAVDANSAYLYVARSGNNGGLATFTIGSGGGLNLVGSAVVAGQRPVSVALNKAGTDVYVADQVGGSNGNGFGIYSYSVSNGAATALSPGFFATVSQPAALAVDNSGKYLLAISNSGGPDLAMYSFDSAGRPVSVTSTATGYDPAGAVAMAVTH